MTELLKGLVIGTIMACLYGGTLWASFTAFRLASFILYGNANIIPLWSTTAVMFVAFFVLFSYQFWERYAMAVMVWFVECLRVPEEEP